MALPLFSLSLFLSICFFTLNFLTFFYLLPFSPPSLPPSFPIFTLSFFFFARPPSPSLALPCPPPPLANQTPRSRTRLCALLLLRALSLSPLSLARCSASVTLAPGAPLCSACSPSLCAARPADGLRPMRAWSSRCTRECACSSAAAAAHGGTRTRSASECERAASRHQPYCSSHSASH